MITNNNAGPNGKEFISIGNDHSSDGPGYLCATSGIGSPYDSDIIASGQVPVEQWVHCAFSKASGTLKIFQNGTEVASASDSQSWQFSDGDGLSICKAGWNTAEYFHGYMRDLRMTKGTGRYTSNFTPPAAGSLTADSDTKLLVFDTAYLKDKSATNHAMTPHGNPRLLGYGANDTAEYTASDHGGSVSLDGDGDYLMAPSGTIASQNNSADFNFSSGAWTWEAWVNPSSLTSPNAPHVFTCRYNSTHRSSLYYLSSANQLTYWSNGAGRISGPALKTNQWSHVALSSDGTTTTMWVNGKSSGTTTHMQSNYDMTMYVGAAVGSGLESSGYWNGNITDARVVKGTQVYTSNFTPPTAPLTAITNTKLLVQSTDAGIIDKAQNAKKTLLVGNTKSSTTQTKFLSSSMYFDGTGDYINAENCEIGNVGLHAFTFEGWFYLTVSPANYITIMQTRASNASQTGFVMAISASDFYIFSNALIGAKGSAISSNQWYHWAYTRDTSGNQRVFLDGTQTGSTYTTARNYTDDKLWIGAKYDGSEYFTGYQSDIRITKGLARYTANFTPPTAALKG